jgi:hypothetical protein
MKKKIKVGEPYALVATVWSITVDICMFVRI